MKILAISAVAAAAMTLSASPALAKAHLQPADQADFGQFEVAKKDLDGKEVSEKAKEKPRPDGDPNRQGPKED